MLVGTQTSIIYNINISISDKPKNLKFYTDENRENEIKVINSQIMFEKFIDIDDAKIKERNLYWEWKYETGDYDELIEYNDELDSQYMNKETKMLIKVTGVQSISKPIYLSDVVQIGDYVDYDASNNGNYTYTTDRNLTGSEQISVFSSISEETKNMKWRVFDVDRETGLVELMAELALENDLALKGKTGYKNSENVINEICSVYGKGCGAIGGRSINVDDINKYSLYEPKLNNNYGKKVRYTGGTFIKEDNSEIIASGTNPIEISHTYYGYDARGINYFLDKSMYTMIFVNTTLNKNYIYLASRCRLPRTDGGCDFGVRAITDTNVGYNSLCSSNGWGGERIGSLLPIVYLSQNIQTSGKNSSEVWSLKIH